MRCSEELMKKATNVPREEMMSMGTCFGKFNRNGKFRLAITSLEYIAQFAKVLSAHSSILPYCATSLRAVQSVGEAVGRALLPVWEPCNVLQHLHPCRAPFDMCG